MRLPDGDSILSRWKDEWLTFQILDYQLLRLWNGFFLFGNLHIGVVEVVILYRVAGSGCEMRIVKGLGFLVLIVDVEGRIRVVVVVIIGSMEVR